MIADARSRSMTNFGRLRGSCKARLCGQYHAIPRGRHSLACCAAINHWLSFKALSHTKCDKDLLLASNFPKKAPERPPSPVGARPQYIADVSPNYLLRNSVPRSRLHFARRHRALVLNNVAVQGPQSLCRQTASHQRCSRGFSRVFFCFTADAHRPRTVSNPP